MTESPDARARAADLLGVPPESSPAEARAAFLKRLEQVDFVPPPHWVAGLALFGVTPAPGAAAALEQSGRESLRAEVDDFARQFWSLAPDERKGRWSALRDRCEGEPALHRRLAQLGAGLDVEAREFWIGDGFGTTLAGLVQELFPLPPLERAARRQAWFDALAGSPVGWQRAADQLRQEAPRVAALEPVLLERIDQLAEAYARPPRRYAPAPAPASEGGRRGSYAAVYVMVFVGIAILRAISGSSSNSSSSPPPKVYSSPRPLPRYEDLTPGQKAAYDATTAKRTVELPGGYTFDPKTGKLKRAVAPKKSEKPELVPTPREVPPPKPGASP